MILISISTLKVAKLMRQVITPNLSYGNVSCLKLKPQQRMALKQGNGPREKHSLWLRSTKQQVEGIVTKSFPDLNDDGKVTRADVLKGRGVEGFKSGKWIQAAIKKPGALRKSLGVKGDKPIPAAKLAKAAKAPGKLGQRARLAQTLKKMK
jgi:hypothetical protein